MEQATKEAQMANEERWRNDERRWREQRDDDSPDWRGAGDDWRRSEQYRSGGRSESGFGGPEDWRRGERDFGRHEWGRGDFGRGDFGRGDFGRGDFGRANFGRGDFGREDWRSGGGYGYGGTGYGGGSTGRDYGFGRDDYPSSRSSYGGRSGGFDEAGWGWGGGSGASFYDRDFGGRGGYSDESRYSGSGWRNEGQGRDPYQRGFLDRASDEVASWFGDREAERRRELDHRGRGPKGYSRSDDRIREDINDRLTDDPYVDAQEIEITVSGSEATLSGFVSTRDQRRRAEDIVERVSGVTHVQNNIRVRSQGTAQSGSDIGQTAFGRESSSAGTTSKAAGTSATGSTPVGASGSSTSGTTGTTSGQRRTGTAS
jgi:osmotically-inducible protein OsmY